MKELRDLKHIASNLTVLYVDSDEDIAKTVINYLSKFFSEVIYVSNAQDGLAFYKDSPVDLVITDIKKPKMGGLDMIYEIRQIKENQNVIITSEYADIENFLSSIKLGIDGYLIKPIDYVDLNRLLFKIINKIHAFKDNEVYLKKVNTLIEELHLKNRELNHYTNALNKVAIVTKVDLKGRITFANDFFCDVCGYSKEELIGKNQNIIRHPDVPKSVYKNLWETIQRGEIWEGDLKNKTKDGKDYYIHATIIPLFEADAKTIKEYIAIRFLTTSDELGRREFKRKVMLNYQDFRKDNFSSHKKITELENKLEKIKSEDIYLKFSSNENKTKQHKLVSQINYYEEEIKKTHTNHNKILEKANNKNKNIIDSHKKALKKIELQNDSIEHLTKEKEIHNNKILTITEQLSEQRKIITDLTDTIKNISN